MLRSIGRQWHFRCLPITLGVCRTSIDISCGQDPAKPLCRCRWAGRSKERQRASLNTLFSYSPQSTPVEAGEGKGRVLPSQNAHSSSKRCKKMEPSTTAVSFCSSKNLKGNNQHYGTQLDWAGCTPAQQPSPELAGSLSKVLPPASLLCHTGKQELLCSHLPGTGTDTVQKRGGCRKQLVSPNCRRWWFSSVLSTVPNSKFTSCLSSINSNYPVSGGMGEPLCSAHEST